MRIGGYDIKSDKMTRVNRAITSPKVRLIGADGEQVGIIFTKDALMKAEEADLDLVEVSPNEDPPVCRIMNYGKYLFELNKKKAAQKKKQKQVQVKEVKLRPSTDVGDYQIKLKSIVRFLEEGNKVKITVRFRGRELMHPELGMALLQRMEADIGEMGLVEHPARFEGRQIVMVIGPKRR